MSAAAAMIVQPKFNYSVSQDGSSATYSVSTYSRGRRALAQPILMLLGFPLVGLLVIGVLHAFAKTGNPAIVFGMFLATLAITVLVHRWGYQQNSVNFAFDGEKLTVGDKAYLWQHVNDLGWRSQSGYAATGNAVHGAKLAYELSGEIYLQYGGEEVTLVEGLHPDKVQSVHGDIIRTMRSVGVEFE